VTFSIQPCIADKVSPSLPQAIIMLLFMISPIETAYWRRCSFLLDTDNFKSAVKLKKSCFYIVAFSFLFPCFGFEEDLILNMVRSLIPHCCRDSAISLSVVSFADHILLEVPGSEIDIGFPTHELLLSFADNHLPPGGV
jgi:hypothetical protein